MFGQVYEQPKREKLPTLPQYVSTLPKTSKALDQTFQVELIWLPGKFDNYTLQTHAFRLIITASHPLYAAIHAMFGGDGNFEGTPSFGLRITDRESLSFTVVEMAKKKGQWQRLGKGGIKFDSN